MKKAEFKQLEEDNIIQQSTSPWSSPPHMVKKVYVSWHSCHDFLQLNLVTEPDFYHLPNMLDFTAKTAGCIVFSKVDLQEGVSSDHCQPRGCTENPAITTPCGLFE